MKVIRCPIHNMPDCSPLLNGCSLPRLLTKQSAVAYDEAVQALAWALNNGPVESALPYVAEHNPYKDK